MHSPGLPESELLKSVLEPLLDDFQYWFARSLHFLEEEEISFLGDEGQSDLLARVKQAQQEVSIARSLFQATGGQAGIEAAVLVPWHKLVTECWQVAMQYRATQTARFE